MAGVQRKKPWQRATPLLAVGWATLGVLFRVSVRLDPHASIPLPYSIAWGVIGFLSAVVSWRLITRDPEGGGPWQSPGRFAATTALLTAVTLVIWTASMEAFDWWISPATEFTPLSSFNPGQIMYILTQDGLAVLAVHAFVLGQVQARYASERAERRVELEQLARRVQLARLQHQLNPHFLFNALASLAGMAVRAPTRAATMVSALADLLRSSISDLDREHTTVAREIDFVRAYVDVERLRFDERLRVNFDIDPDTHDKVVPPWVVHLLVENAIKHGMRGNAKTLHVAVMVRLRKGWLEVVVRNNGRLIPPSEASGIGLDNLRARLRVLLGSAWQLRLVESGAHVVATLVLPATTTPHWLPEEQHG